MAEKMLGKANNAHILKDEDDAESKQIMWWANEAASEVRRTPRNLAAATQRQALQVNTLSPLACGASVPPDSRTHTLTRLGRARKK